MTTSPYDNMPVNNVNAGKMQNNAVPAPDTENTPKYVDVDIQEASPEELGIPAAETHVAPISPEVPKTPAEPVKNKQPDVKPYKRPEVPAPEIRTDAGRETPPKPVHRSRTRTTPMPQPPQYTNLNIKNRRAKSEYILPFEESLLVPDTMPDMSEILFAEASVYTSKPAGSRYESNDFISGDITYYTVYRPDAGDNCPVDVIRSSIPFKTDKCWGSSRDSTFRASASIRSVRAEKVNERKFIARGELIFRVTEISQQELPVFRESADPELVCRHDSVKAADLTFEAEETTDISQEINIKEGDPEPVKILKESIRIIENHKQITSGKLVINAVISSNILYLGDSDGEQKLCRLENRTDFTQFIPVKGDLDVSMISADFTGSELKMNISGSDEFQLQGQVKTIICGYSDTELPMVCDAYHKSRDIGFELAAQPVTAVTGTVCGEISAREVINIDDSLSRPEQLVCGSCSISEISGSLENGRIVIEGSVPVTILAIDENNVPFTVQSTVPLRGSLEMPAPGDDSTIEVNAQVKEFWYDEINSRQLEVNISTAISVWICRTATFSSVSDICFRDSDEPAATAPIAVYVTGRGDTLWDIAKRYKCDADSVASRNHLDLSKPLAEGTKLLIMR
ncbi:MAG: DUF3794 domain-containing protein [Firmicutes bacterium]|nr:DUF3794 domain-containing protein [Bacillota bacterium]